MHCHGTMKSHLPLMVMVGRCLRRPDIRIRHQDGCQARGFPHLTRPKIQQKSSTSEKSRSTKHKIRGSNAVNSHLSLMVMVGRCLRRPDIKILVCDGRQARGFPYLMRPKSQPKFATLGRCKSTNQVMHVFVLLSLGIERDDRWELAGSHTWKDGDH